MKLIELIDGIYKHGLTQIDGEHLYGNFLGEFNDEWLKNERIFKVRDFEENILRIPTLDPFEENDTDLTQTNIEKLAFYVSYHFSRDKWGIYILKSGIHHLAGILVKNGYDATNALDMASKFLVRHELGHFQLDFAITNVELLNNFSIYAPMLKSNKVDQPPWNLIEEGLCNRLALSNLGKAGKQLKEYLKNSPDGYKDFEKHKVREELKCWLNLLDNNSKFLKTMNNSILSTISHKSSQSFFHQVPIWYINDMYFKNDSPGYLGVVQKIKEEQKFIEDLKFLSKKNKGKYEKLWSSAKRKLNSGNLVGVHLHQIKDNIHTINLDKESRAAIKVTNEWKAVGADHHENIYRRINKKEFDF